MAIDFPNSPTDGQTLTVGSSVYTYSAAKGVWNLSSTITYVKSTDLGVAPLDNIVFDGVENRFFPATNGVIQTISNPYNLLININGILQSIGYPELVWGSPINFDGFTVDSDGYIAFSEVPPAGSNFSGRILPGSTTQPTVSTYPFKATDILLGAN